jgi:GAF domain-containing protein
VSSSEALPTDVWTLVDNEPALAGDPAALSGWLRRLCRATTRALPATAVGITMGAPSSESVRLAGSGDQADLLEQLQFTLGEGPCHDAFSAGRPVFVPDVDGLGGSRWPGYTPALQEHGVKAVFAFPLRIGAVKLGTLDVYRDTVGTLDDRAVAQAVAFSTAATTALLDGEARPQGRGAGTDASRDELLSGSAEIYQAQGMVQVQLGVKLDEAMARLRAYAYAHDRAVRDVARDIVARRLTLERDS